MSVFSLFDDIGSCLIAAPQSTPKNQKKQIPRSAKLLGGFSVARHVGVPWQSYTGASQNP
jgi:hypothetical protein